MTIFSLTFTAMFFYFHLFFVTSVTSTTKSQRLITRLIHWDSIFHPEYNPNETLGDRTKRNIDLSASRIASLHSKSKRSTPRYYNIPVELRPIQGAMFLVEYYIGQPPIRQLGTIDTGSHITWVQCKPCVNCFEQSQYQIFDPSRSSTYTPLTCESPECLHLDHTHCDLPKSNKCLYHFSYHDKTSTKGVLAKEQFTFNTLQKGTVHVQNLTFGCGHQNYINDNIYYPVFGLDSNALSIAYQLGDMFSYCIGSITDPTYSYNSLIFGYGLDTEGDSTPFEPVHDLFFVTLEGISVGEKRLDIDPYVFQRSYLGGGTFIDSGTTHSWLVKDAYYALRKEVERLASGVLTRARSYKTEGMLCFYGKVGRELVGFPVVTFHFAGGAELAMDAMSFFEPGSDYYGHEIFCMAVALSEDSNLPNGKAVSVIGVLAQQNYNVVFDMKRMKIYFQRIDCELLIDT